MSFGPLSNGFNRFNALQSEPEIKKLDSGKDVALFLSLRGVYPIRQATLAGVTTNRYACAHCHKQDKFSHFYDAGQNISIHDRACRCVWEKLNERAETALNEIEKKEKIEELKKAEALSKISYLVSSKKDSDENAAQGEGNSNGHTPEDSSTKSASHPDVKPKTSTNKPKKKRKRKTKGSAHASGNLDGQHIRADKSTKQEPQVQAQTSENTSNQIKQSSSAQGEAPINKTGLTKDCACPQPVASLDLMNLKAANVTTTKGGAKTYSIRSQNIVRWGDFEGHIIATINKAHLKTTSIKVGFQLTGGPEDNRKWPFQGTITFKVKLGDLKSTITSKIDQSTLANFPQTITKQKSGECIPLVNNAFSYQQLKTIDVTTPQYKTLVIEECTYSKKGEGTP